jgi:hypothetical protein
VGGGLATCVGSNSTLSLEGNTSAEALRYAFVVVLLNGVKSHEGSGILDFLFSEGTALLVGRVSREEEEEEEAAEEERVSKLPKLTIRMRRCTM